MNTDNIVLWGFAATMILTTIMTVAKHLGLTRMDLPFILGTLFTGDRNKAPWVGFLAHVSMGWLFAFIYGAAFETSGFPTCWNNGRTSARSRRPDSRPAGDELRSSKNGPAVSGTDANPAARAAWFPCTQLWERHADRYFRRAHDIRGRSGNVLFLEM